jgi:hypothetical protein
MSTVEEEMYYHTGKAGDVVRQLGFAALAAVWIFHSSNASRTLIPGSFKWAIVLVVVSMAIDVFSISWEQLHGDRSTSKQAILAQRQPPST